SEWLTEKDPAIAYIAIINEKNRLLAFVPTDSPDHKPSQAKGVVSEVPAGIRDLQSGAGSVYDIAVPVTEGINTIGSVHVGLSRKKIESLVGELSTSLLLFISGVAFLFIGVSYLVSGYMTRRISDLTRTSDEISRGNLDIHPDIGHEIKCWEMKNCNEFECPAYNDRDIPCWYVDQTLGCGGGLSGNFPEKVEACRGCDVYQKHVGDELLQLARSLRNMTIRLKSSEAGVRESEKKYRSLFDSGPNPVFVVDREAFEIIDANQAALKSYGYSKEELVGKPFTDLGPFAYEEACYSDSEKDDSLKAYTFSQKVRHYKKDKTPFYVNVHSCPITYGEREAVIIVTTDITEMMEKDAQLIQASKMTSLGELSAGIAHELNQPLNAIRVGNEFLKKMIDERKKISDQDLYQVVHEVRSQVDRAAEIINRLREFGRKAEFTKEKIEINKPIKEVFAIIGQQLTLQNIEVELDLDEALPPIWAHNNRLEQVIFNLVTNARDAIAQKQNGVSDSNGRIIGVRSYSESDRVVVTVSDTGIGIPDDARDKVFEPFFTTKETGYGMGLGLSIAYGIVRDYEGDIHVESNQGEGTTFKLTFPVARE
ncbi:MAG: ATP-binding protein, partial [Desulfobacteraceae bacterium]